MSKKINMKSLAVILLFFIPLISFSQVTAEEFDAQKWEGPLQPGFSERLGR